MDNLLSQEYLNSGRRKANKHFAIMPRADDPNLARANAQLKADIAGGANGVAVIFEGAHNAYGYGLPAEAASLDKLFDGVELDGLHIRIDHHPHGQALTEKCVEFLHKRRFDPKTTKITFGIDPIATLATTGRLKMSLAALKASMPQSMSAFFSAGLPGVVLEADGRIFHNAGASRAQEIGAMLAIARSHLQMVEHGRHHVAYALPHIGFATALDQDVAQSIAKLHVLQRLWQKLQAAYDIESPFPTAIHAETSMRMMTARDSRANTPRASAAAIAAIAGGASSLTVLPYSQPLGLPNAEARREARNIPLIFTREASPAELISGSALVPNAALVESLAAAAWEEFELFEKQGGILQSLTDGSLLRRISDAQDLTIASHLKGEEGIIGTTDYRADAADEDGIYDEPRREFEPQGIEHCKPLSFRRLDAIFEEAEANMPSDAH